MTRKDLATIIKARSTWKIDRRRGDYKLPNGERLSAYVYNLVKTQLELDSLGILSNGNIAFLANNKILMPAFKPNEETTATEQEERIQNFVNELIR